MRKIVGVAIVAVIIAGLASGLAIYYTHQLWEESEEYKENPPPIDYKKNLLTKPDDWELIMREVSNEYVDISELDKSYWIQPDFYPRWERAKKFYESHDYSRWGVFGYGAYPGNPTIVFNNRKVGSWINFTILYKTGYGIETWQGIKLVPEESEYFNVEITPDEFLLKPTFPVFHEDWVRKLSIDISVKKEPPKGNYTIPIHAEAPSKDNAEKWFWEVLRKETVPEEREMIQRAKIQADKTGELPEKFVEWVETGRKNKFVTAGRFRMSPQIKLKIQVR